MILSDELDKVNTIFIDTAPVIYFIEAHPQFGHLAKEVVVALTAPRKLGNLNAYSSVNYL